MGEEIESGVNVYLFASFPGLFFLVLWLVNLTMCQKNARPSATAAGVGPDHLRADAVANA